MTKPYILSNSNDSNDVALFVASSCGVEQNFNASTVLGDQWEFEVRCFCPAKGSIKDRLDGSLEIFCDKLLNQGMAFGKYAVFDICKSSSVGTKTNGHVNVHV